MNNLKVLWALVLTAMQLSTSAQTIEFSYPNYFVNGVQKEKNDIKELLAQKSKSNVFLLSSQKHHKNSTTAAWLIPVPTILSLVLYPSNDDLSFSTLFLQILVVGLGVAGSGVVAIIALNENEQGRSHFKKAISAWPYFWRHRFCL